MWHVVCKITNLANECWNVHRVGGETHPISHAGLYSKEMGHKLLQLLVDAQVTYRTIITRE